MSTAHLMFMDILGIPKEIALPVGALEAAVRAGVPFDGSALEGFARTAEAEMRLMPDPATDAAVPDGLGFARGDRRLLASIAYPDGMPYDGCPRTRLVEQLSTLDHSGLTLEVGAEVEFFLLSANSAPQDVPVPEDRAGYFDAFRATPEDRVRAETADALETLGVRVEASHHEVGPGQHEIDLSLADPLGLADSVVTTRWLLRTLALARGLRATFMPKPFGGVSGSGLHVSLSVCLPEGPSENRGDHWAGSAGHPSPFPPGLEGFAAGILAHARGLSCLANPVVNSYKRLVPGYEAPLYVSWARHQRSPLLRILPESGGNGASEAVGSGRRVVLEYRAADAAANPYLLLCGMIAGGLDGMRRDLRLPPAIEENPGLWSGEERRHRGVGRLPRDLREALDAFDEDEVIQESMGETICEQILEARAIEWDIYQETVHPWEREQYLDSL